MTPQEIKSNISNMSEEGAKDMLERIIMSSYELVLWPDSQEYMEEDWFNKEAILSLGNEDEVGSSAYFIPVKYIL